MGSTNPKSWPVFICFPLCLLLWASSVFALDDDSSRRTLCGLKGVYVIVEALQPSLPKFVQSPIADRDQLQKNVELRLKEAGIRILDRQEWLQTAGKPVLYINVNTHQFEKYLYAYDIRVEIRQTAFMEANPDTKAFVATWSSNITGAANIGSLNVLWSNARTLVDLFIRSYLSANQGLANGNK